MYPGWHSTIIGSLAIGRSTLENQFVPRCGEKFRCQQASGRVWWGA